MNDTKELTSIKRLSRLLDSGFTLPGTSYRFGLDGIIGLIPVAGDLVTAVIGAFIMFSALRFRVSGWVMMKMGFNLILDLTVGAIPIAGDLFDFAFKSHDRNIELIESWLEEPEVTERQSRMSITVSVVAAIFILTLLVSLGIYLLYTLGVIIFEIAGNLI
jgi:hypothetical protein